MDEDTEQLREVFVEATGTETATTDQRADRGSLLSDDGDEREGLVAVVAGMREALGFETDLDDDDLATVVERFYAGDGDAAIATALGVDERTVVRARMDLHLLREGDADPELLAAVEAGHEVDADLDVDADPDIGADPDALTRAEGVARAQERARRVSERFRAAFEERLTDADLEGKVVGDARADGLREAAEDIDPELDLSF